MCKCSFVRIHENMDIFTIRELFLNPYAAGDLFGQDKMLQKKTEKWLKTRHTATYLRVLSESYPMNTHMTWFRWFSNIFVSLCFGQ